jgi:hypothetical protein
VTSALPIRKYPRWAHIDDALQTRVAATSHRKICCGVKRKNLRDFFSAISTLHTRRFVMRAKFCVVASRHLINTARGYGGLPGGAPNSG